jgi:hypothetical protein
VGVFSGELPVFGTSNKAMKVAQRPPLMLVDSVQICLCRALGVGDCGQLDSLKWLSFLL